MISRNGKSNRVKVAKMLVSAGLVREKIKTFINYPKLESISISANATNAQFKVTLIDRLESVKESYQNSNDISLELNREISGNDSQVDPSSDNAAMKIQLNQDGIAWDSSDFIVQSKFSDGTNQRKLIFPKKSGDGTENANQLQITTNIEEPDGWGKI